MAPSTSFSLTFFLIFSFIFVSVANAETPKYGGVTYPIKKDTPETRLYYTTLQIGTPPRSVDFTLTLAGQLAVWYVCEAENYNSTSYKVVHCGSSGCVDAGGFGCSDCIDPVVKPGCTNDTCPVGAYNRFGQFIASAGLYTDVLRVPSRTAATVPSLPIASASTFLFDLRGLPKTTKGMIGLAMSKVSFPTYISSALKLANTFALCLPSSGTGKLLIGGGPYHFGGKLTETPLVINPNSTAPIYGEGDASEEYFIGVKSIKVAGVHVPLNATLLSFDKDGYGGTKLSTVDPHTVLHTSIYKPLVDAFMVAARAMKMKRAPDYGYFHVCYTSASIASDTHGRIVPTIDLVLQNESTNWRMYGSDLMVRVSNNVLCLGVVVAGKNPRTAIVIGGRQLENRLVEFDLVHKKLRFGAPLIRLGTTTFSSS